MDLILCPGFLSENLGFWSICMLGCPKLEKGHFKAFFKLKIIWWLFCAYLLIIGYAMIIHWQFTWIWLFDDYLWQGGGDGEKQHIYNRPQGVTSSPTEGGLVLATCDYWCLSGAYLMHIHWIIESVEMVRSENLPHFVTRIFIRKLGVMVHLHDGLSKIWKGVIFKAFLNWW